MSAPGTHQARRNERQTPLQIAHPFALQAEQHLIGALIWDPIVTTDLVIDFLHPDYFYDPFCRKVYETALEYLCAAKVPDAVILAHALEGVLPMDAQSIKDRLEGYFYMNPGRGNIEVWAQIIVDKAIDRGIARTGERLMALAHAQGRTADEKMAEATNLLADISAHVSEDAMVGTEEMLLETMALVESNANQRQSVVGLSTGYPELDEITAGLQPGDLVIVAARPSMGKTSFAMGLTHAVCVDPPLEKRKPVLMFSLEMGTSSIGMRWLSSVCNINFGRLRAGKIETADWAKLKQAQAESAQWPFHIEPTGGLTVNQIATRARRVHRDHGLAMVVIDYLQLIAESDDGNRNRNRSEALSDISRALKALAKELKIPIVALSQLNRSLEQRADKRPIMSDLRESGALEQDADLIMFLYRDVVYNKNTAEPHTAEVIIGKQRNGALGTVKLGFDGPTTKFHNNPPERADPFGGGYRDPTGERRDAA